MEEQKKKINSLKVLLVFSVFVLAVLLLVVKMKSNSLKLSVSDGETIHLEYGIDEELPEVTAVYRKSILDRKGTPVDVTMEGEVNFEKLGNYEVSYSACYKKKAVSAKGTIVIEDTTPPVIVLKTNPDYFTRPGEQYVEEGFSAVDNYNGDITAQVVRQEKDDVITYTVSDSSGNEAVATRKIVYNDGVPPELSLQGEKEIYILAGESYSEPGYTAVDAMDGDLTEQVDIDNKVDTGKAGSYTITYAVTDSEGNTSTATRSVYVYQKQEENVVEVPADKVVYLTFDDGPGKYTEKLLNILDKYGVKATFFVTNQYPKYQNLIGEANKRGHTIAMHTYSHNYGKIYKSKQAYFEDLALMSDVCYEQTGVRPTIIRFPGGASNTISKKYCEGIMSSLTKSLPDYGYLYCDWNVASGDADGAETADEVASNVIQGIQNRSVSVVLQHDTKEFSVDAVEKILRWGLANGYTFLPLTEDTPMVHHKVNN